MAFLNSLYEIFSGLIADSGFLLFFEGDGYKYIIMILVALFFI